MRKQIEAELDALPVRDDCRDIIAVEAAALALLHLVGGKPYCLDYDDEGKGIHLLREGVRLDLCMRGSFFCHGLEVIERAGNYRGGNTGNRAKRTEFTGVAVAFADGMDDLDGRLRAALRNPKGFRTKKFERDARPIRDVGYAMTELIKALGGWDGLDFEIWMPRQWSEPPPVSRKVARRIMALTRELAGLLRDNPEALRFMPYCKRPEQFADDLKWWAETLEYRVRQQEEPEAPLFVFEEPPSHRRGRPVELYPRLVAGQARGAYERLTGLRATRRFDPVTGRAGPFEEFLDSLFASMGIGAGAARQVRQLMDKITADA